MRDPKKTLEELLEKRVITGYNIFDRPLERQTYTFILSNLHETGAYMEDVEKDLKSQGYSHFVPFSIRNRDTVFHWKPNYNIRDSRGNLWINLRIRDKNNYLDLGRYAGKTLPQSGVSEEYCRQLVGETKGYEIALFSDEREEIVNLASLFIIKSIEGLFSWRDAYDTPFILIEGLDEDLEGFERVKGYSLFKEGKECFFISREEIPENLRADFVQKTCFVNQSFFHTQFKPTKDI
ncbi:MAG: hypothetical protein Q8R18_05455 [bacterium]|nr:hypothetical protein [bacterium]